MDIVGAIVRGIGARVLFDTGAEFITTEVGENVLMAGF